MQKCFFKSVNRLQKLFVQNFFFITSPGINICFLNLMKGNGNCFTVMINNNTFDINANQ